MASVQEQQYSGDKPTRHTDKYGNEIPQPSTTFMYGQPSGGQDVFGYGNTTTTDVPREGFGGGGDGDVGVKREPLRGDPTQRRGTTTGEYGAEVGFIDRAKEKLKNVGGFKEDKGHVTTAGMENNGDRDDGYEERKESVKESIREKIKEKLT